MNFHLTDKQCDLRDEFRAYFDKLMTPELVAELNQTTGEGGGDLTRSIRQALVDIQFGRAEDSFGWMHRIV